MVMVTHKTPLSRHDIDSQRTSAFGKIWSSDAAGCCGAGSLQPRDLRHEADSHHLAMHNWNGIKKPGPRCTRPANLHQPLCPPLTSDPPISHFLLSSYSLVRKGGLEPPR